MDTEQFEIRNMGLSTDTLNLVNRHLIHAGKKIRPNIILKIATSLDLDPKLFTPYMQAAEWVHSATLAHDDVLDQALERRNTASLPAVTSQSRSILIGDLLLSKSMATLCDQGHLHPVKRMSEVLESMVRGEWLQQDYRKKGYTSPFDRTAFEDWENIAKFKTAALTEWCFEIPFFLAGKDASCIELAKEIGKRLGIVFQMQDDLLDFQLNHQKDFAKDLKDDNPNAFLFTWLSAASSAEQMRILSFKNKHFSAKDFFEAVDQKLFQNITAEYTQRIKVQFQLIESSIQTLDFTHSTNLHQAIWPEIELMMNRAA